MFPYIKIENCSIPLEIECKKIKKKKTKDIMIFDFYYHEIIEWPQ